MRRRATLLVLAAVLVSGGCEHTTRSRIMNNPPVKPLRLAARDPAYRLAPDERARVIPAYDADALERLMGMIHPDLRPKILENFLIWKPGELPAGERAGLTVELYDPSTGQVDPQLQAVLEEVYAPLWARVSDDDLEKPNFMVHPGREREKQRRQNRPRGRGPNNG